MASASVPLLHAAPPWKPDLSEYVILWHGCTVVAKNHIEAHGIDLARCAVDTDFGRGFYTTTLQRQARCETCGEITEQAVHRCGRPTRLIRGWRRLDNDGVNLLAAGAGGSIAVMLMSLV